MSKPGHKVAIAFVRCEKGGSAKSPGVSRQRDAIAAFAERSGYAIVAEFADEEANGPASLGGPGFAAMLKRFEANGVDTIIVPTVGTLAKDAVVQAVAHAKLRQHGIDVVAADAPMSSVDDVTNCELVDRILATAAILDEAFKKAHLKGVGERLRVKSNPPHRKTYAEMHPEAVQFAKHLHQGSLKAGERLSLREISAKLARAGYLRDGKPFHPEVVRRMIRGARPRPIKGF